ncbi:MAG: carboxypeptidase regulatory-like domain-containing protein [Candidatus Marinimicrobia bacterium]|nr:carboxypeptidase regulatory-like domain-containing protein [Candidatus Neomarinimicrobiota bacterium]
MRIIRTALLAISATLIGTILITCEPPTEAKTTGSIEGIIYDAATSQPLVGVTITTEPITSSKITDTNGSFKIEGVEPGDYTLQAAKTGYSINTTTVHIVAGETATADLQLTVVTPELSVSITTLDFGSTSSSLPFTIINSGEGTLEWSVVENSDWISVNPANGNIADEQSSVIVSVDRSGLSAGDYTETIAITSNGGSSSIQVTTNVEGPVLILSNNSLSFGTSTDNLTFTVSNGGIGELTYNAVYSAGWLTVTPTSGSASTETDVLTVTVNRSGLAYGNYFETITMTSNSNSETVDVMMTIPDPSSPQLSAYPASVDFGSNSLEEKCYITNTGSGMLSWNISNDKSWISCLPVSGTTESETDEVVITVDRLGLSPGDYTGTVTITSDGGNQNINLSMVIPDEPSLSIAPSYLDFGTSESIMPFNVANAGTGDLDWSVSDNQEWITTSPSSGSGYGTVNVSITRDGLSTGDYSGTVTVSSNGGTGYAEIYMSVGADLPPSAVIMNDATEITTSSILLDWEMNTDDDFFAYNLYRSDEASVSESSTLISQIVNRYTLDHIDDDLADETTYYYRIFVEDAIGQTTGSNTVSATTLNAPGTWGVFASVSVDLYGVSALNDNFAYVVGDSGKIYKWDGSSLSEQDSPTTERLGGVGVVATNDIWISGEGGVWHNTSGFWVQEAGYPTSVCYDMDFVSSDSIWVAGNSEIYFFNGTSWTTLSMGSDRINDINMNNSTSGWAITNDAESYHYNGVSWSLLSDEQGTGYSIWGSTSSNIWIGGDGLFGYWEIAHWDGSVWDYSYFETFDFNPIRSIEALNQDDIWFAGNYEMLYWNGSNLTEHLNPSSSQINKITFTDSNSGWGVCDDGVVLRYSP